jgi:quercetin dioxygenase-like cupin family protein
MPKGREHAMKQIMTMTTVGVALFGAALLATPGNGYLFNVVVNRATATRPLHVIGGDNGWFASLVTNRPADFVVQDVSLAPAGYSGWHSHPGPVLITVKTGTATWYEPSGDRCRKFVYPTGSAFVEAPNVVHAVQNEGAEDMELINTYIVPVGVPTRTEEDNPGTCPGVP